MARLTTGPVGGHLIRMAAPLMLGIFAMMAFNVADTWFISQLGTAELAAVSFTFPVVMVISAASIGLGAGTSSVVARAIGQSDWPRVQRLATDALVLAAIAGIVLAVIGYLSVPALFRGLGANDQTLPLVVDYMRVWLYGAPLLLVPMVGMATIRATGDTVIPSAVMIGWAILNFTLDPLLIFGFGPIPGYGLDGAAWASVLARVAFAVTAMVVLLRVDLLTIHVGSWAQLRRSWREILHVGLPAAGTNAIIPIATGVATAMIAGFGQTAVAGFGVASRIESLSLIMFYALSAIIGPFAGQNLGAGKIPRICRALALCNVFSFGAGVGIAVLLILFGRDIALFFNEDPAVVSVAVSYFWIVPLSYGTASMVMVMNATFNGLGRPMPAVMVSMARMVFIFLPLAWLGAHLAGVQGIFVALALANVVCGIGAYVWVRRALADEQRTLDERPYRPTEPGAGSAAPVPAAQSDSI
ncbi:MAG: MATE family efflux transporter [Pseudomonadota bacterium]